LLPPARPRFVHRCLLSKTLQIFTESDDVAGILSLDAAAPPQPSKKSDEKDKATVAALPDLQKAAHEAWVDSNEDDLVSMAEAVIHSQVCCIPS
jgi:hypothetical protein